MTVVARPRGEGILPLFLRGEGVPPVQAGSGWPCNPWARCRCYGTPSGVTTNITDNYTARYDPLQPEACRGVHDAQTVPPDDIIERQDSSRESGTTVIFSCTGYLQEDFGRLDLSLLYVFVPGR